jgi:hypothetical protein
LTWVSRFKLQYEALCGTFDAAPKPIREIANERCRVGY